ncbi:fumarylacetoacetate hydrolase family protein [Membranicola marinus]|uniref:Fumarylacetoacetate hydrolase family protein n=1 Tax=Membranihabitans marinus TaxID=1227546 RepID=A0A953LB07_9BACT|nr:fumarylacetoacetate hydrolase family protein [Membranihabitans marinus]MBY5959248.1 fumarylacetoacetate hydrolase family protein [Membranihabitans marinus]
MKLIRYGNPGEEKPGILIDGKRFDVSDIIEDYDTAFFGSDGITDLQDKIDAHSLKEVDADVRWGVPMARPGKIVCIGLNYADHAAESGMDAPEEPVIFFKATSSMVGPYDDVIIPKGSEKTDWEVELGVVIGKKASYVTEAEAMNHVAGYVLHNDVSERAFQIERGGQWVKGKSCDTFAPVGPWIATPDEISDVNNLNLWLKINGKKLQDGTSADLIFKIPHIIHYLSQFMTLEPGDIISTGTPAGVGLGLNPPTFLKPGDVMELGIDGLGSSKQHVKAYSGQ